MEGQRSPTPPITVRPCVLLPNASVAQPVERRSEEPGVASSTLAGGTIPFRLMGRTSVFDSDNGSSSLPTGTTKNYERNDYYEQKISKYTKNMEDRTYRRS